MKLNNNRFQHRFNEVKKISFFALAIIIIAIIIHCYVLAKVVVDGPSMQPTLHDKDVLFIEKISNKINHIKRGYIVIFDSKDTNGDYYIKRVIGIAGDTIEIKNDKVYLNGKQLRENYLSSDIATEALTLKTKFIIPDNYVFVLGDNRTNSTDSRILGAINIKDLKGHVILRAFPFNKITTFK